MSQLRYNWGWTQVHTPADLCKERYTFFKENVYTIVEHHENDISVLLSAMFKWNTQQNFNKTGKSLRTCWGRHSEMRKNRHR